MVTSSASSTGRATSRSATNRTSSRDQAPALVQERAKQTREQLIVAAAEVFSDVGYSAARLEDIAALARMTKGALYFHFRSKEDIAVAVVQAHFAAWTRQRERISSSTNSALIAVVSLSANVAAEFQRSVVARAGVRLGNEYWALQPAVELPVPFVDWIDYITHALRRARRDGEIAPAVNCAAASRVIVASFFGMYEVSARLSAGEDLLDRVREWWNSSLRPCSPPMSTVTPS